MIQPVPADGERDSSVAELFHENSKIYRADPRVRDRIRVAMTNPTLQRLMTSAHKRYPSTRKVALPKDDLPNSFRLDQAVAARRSAFEFAEGPLTLAQIAKCLRFAAGVTGIVHTPAGATVYLHAAPSGGALYPVETYLVAAKLTGLESGLYHFCPVDDCLEVVQQAELIGKFSAAAFTPQLANAAAIFILTGVSLKSRLKYGERGYRFMLLEAGHIAQNILLTAAALELGAVPVGGFVDDEMDRLLGIDGLDEVSLYLVGIGRK
jgi:SagB-type dehydrogenase family enzyme